MYDFMHSATITFSVPFMLCMSLNLVYCYSPMPAFCVAKLMSQCKHKFGNYVERSLVSWDMFIHSQLGSNCVLPLCSLKL